MRQIFFWLSDRPISCIIGQAFELFRPLSHNNSVTLVVVNSIMTPYYSEETVYSKSDLEMENEDGVSIIYYLQKIFPGL